MSGPSDPSPSGASSPEVRRRRREFWIIVATGIAVVVLVLFETRLPRASGRGSFVSDGLLIALLDLNLILLVLLVFLVGRNVLKLVLERRRGIMGSRLRARLVGAFVAIALLPATFLLLAGFVFMNNSIDRWFESQVENSLEGSLDVANAYYEDLAKTSLGFAGQIATRVGADGLLHGRRAVLKRFLDAQRREYQLDVVEVHVPGRPGTRSRLGKLPSGIGTEPDARLVHEALAGRPGTGLERVGKADVIRAAAPIEVGGRPVGVVVVDAFVPKSVVQRRASIEENFREYVGLKLQRKPIRTTYTIMLLVVTVVAIFSAVWLGFYLARGITVPLQRLAEGARRVAQGDLDQHIRGEGADEVGTLVGAFNRMTADLKTSRTELESRRRYLETVLANVTAGVVSADADGRITTMNRAAEVLLGVPASASVGRSIEAAFAAEAFADLRQLAAGLQTSVPRYPFLGFGGNGRAAPVERQLKLTRDGQEISLLLAGTPLLDDAGGTRGVVLFLEEVTHLLRVQRMEAWREVARRIAHEIKNPLTPIALSAQRLRRRYAAQLGAEGAVFDDCTRTIIQQVEELKTLVNEFSTFARMPAGKHVPQDLNRLVEEALVLFREGHRDSDFVFVQTPDLPALELDREGVKRAIINILDNAVAACAQRRDAAPGERGRVELRTSHDGAMDVVRLEIADNGPGMTADVKARLFEPYFSTKFDGTGLGLAIVSAIVADHNGFIRVRDNLPRGSRFILEFPVRRRATQLAAQARVGAYTAGA